MKKSPLIKGQIGISKASVDIYKERKKKDLTKRQPKLNVLQHTKGAITKESTQGRVVEKIIRTSKKTNETANIYSSPPIKYGVSEINERLKAELEKPDRICCINQPKGLKSIIFAQKIALHYASIGYRVIWPVDGKLCEIQKHTDKIVFVDRSIINIPYQDTSFININNALIVPLQHAQDNLVFPEDDLSSKYVLWNMNVAEWKKGQWNRDMKAENKLYYEILGLKDDTRYHLASMCFHDGATDSIYIPPRDDMKNIYMEPVSSFTLFDWSKVIENASVFSTVSNAVMFWAEMLETKAETYNLYLEDCDKIRIHNWLIKKPYEIKNE